MMIHEAIKEAVAERGSDYIYTDHYPSCQYAVDGEPACIVGVALSKMGVSLVALQEIDEAEDSAVEGLVREGLFPVTLTETEASALAIAQDRQDSGFTWGQALEAFERELA